MPHACEDRRVFTNSIGVSAIVKLLRSPFGEGVVAGRVGMVVGQAPGGRERYQVMVPGDPFTYSFPAVDLEVLQGVELETWWR